MEFIRRVIRQILSESTLPSFDNKTIVCVDIQPEYESYFDFKTHNWTQFLNNSCENNNVVLLYNGPDLGMISEHEYIHWLIENGLEESTLNSIRLIDKSYAFFRYCMDNNIDEDAIVDLVKFMMVNSINDSRDMDEDMWNDFSGQHPHDDVRELLDGADDLISIPDLMDQLRPLHNIMLTGGGVSECLKEVEIALKALGKSYGIIDEFTY